MDSKLQRYDFESFDFESGVKRVASEDGEWVRYSDVAPLVSQHSAMLEALRDCLKELDKYAPKSCGACGTPYASCDTECMAAVSYSELTSPWRKLVGAP